MTATPAGLQSYQKSEKHTQLKRSFQAHTPLEPDSALQRLRQKLQKGCISKTERSVLHILETQTATQAQAAARTKAAMHKAANAEPERLTSAQTEARLKSRVRAVEIAAAKARTNFIPEGPLAEEQEAKGPDAYNAAPHNFKRQHTSKAHSNQEYWDCYFHHNQRASQPQPAHQTCDTDEEEDGNDQDPFSSCDQGSDPDSDCIDLDSDEEAEQECAGRQHQQHPQSFYKQPPCLMSVTSAFHQLVNFVKQLPQRVKDDKAAAHLKTFESRKVHNKTDLSSAARRIWLAVHPDKNHAPAAQEVTKALGSLLDSLKVKGAL